MNKLCCICKISKPINEFYNDKSRKDGHATMCILCNKSKGKKYREENKSLIDIKAKKYYLESKIKHNLRSKKWVEENQERHNLIVSKHKKKNRDILSDSYIVGLLGFKKGELPKELIELKRVQLQLKRECLK